jgi:cytochrome b involved in lipid metabolism
VILDNNVYDVTKYLRFHPGGSRLILQVAGKDATADFLAIHHSKKARRLLDTYWVGQCRRKPDQQQTFQLIPSHWGKSLAPSKTLNIAPNTS